MIAILHFPFEINESLQVGDTIYYVPYAVNTNITSNSANLQGTPPQIAYNTSSPIEIGTVQEIGYGQNPTVQAASTILSSFGASIANPVQWLSINITNTVGASTIPAGSMIMFSKDNKVNISSLVGYYALARFENDSTDRAELFSVEAVVHRSSK